MTNLCPKCKEFTLAPIPITTVLEDQRCFCNKCNSTFIMRYANSSGVSPGDYLEFDERGLYESVEI